MKKYFALLAVLFISVQMLFAVPAGNYYDNRGNLKAIVQSDGTIISIANNGNRRQTYTVVKENSNGSFQVKLVINGQIFGEPLTANEWWSENGEIHLNLMWESRTLVRQ